MKDFDFEGRVAIITGGSRGIGKSIASAFARANASVVITARNVDLLEQLTEEIINELELPEGCTCYKPGFGVQCKAKDIGVESFAKCLEKDPYACKFSVSFGYSYYCTCPVRVYLAKELKKEV